MDGGKQRRSFTDISDGVAALIKIIENKNGIATGKIYNIGNPTNDLSIRELATLMDTASGIPGYRERAGRVRLGWGYIEAHYGKGYQTFRRALHPEY